MVEPYYQDEQVTLFHGDCREVMPTEDGMSVVTDPPYGDTSLRWDIWPEGWTEILRSARSVWCFGSMRMFLDRGHEFTREGLKYGQEIVWEKHNGSGFANDRFKRVHEFAVHYYRGTWSDVYKDPQFTNDARKRTVRRKERPTHTGEIAGTTYTSVDGGPRLMRSVIPVRSMHGRAVHPTEKPLGILGPLIRYSTPAGGTVYDPFAGSGATLEAARAEGRKAIGSEVDERYCETIATRLSQGVLDISSAAP